MLRGDKEARGFESGFKINVRDVISVYIFASMVAPLIAHLKLN